MPDLFQTLRSTDLDLLNRIARAWKVEFAVQDFASSLDELVKHAKKLELLEEVINGLPARSLKAWQYLLQHQGRISWSLFTRQYGELRVFGVAKRSREEPDIHPISATEELWYRGLIGRAFLDLPPEPQEYVYIPDEFLSYVQLENNPDRQIDLRPASSLEKKVLFPASDSILDEITDMLAELRMDRPTAPIFVNRPQGYNEFLPLLLQCAGVLTGQSAPDATMVKGFLAMLRGEALLSLFQDWRSSKLINDLRMIPGLLFEGNWNNNVLIPRELVIGCIAKSGIKTWWSLHAFLTQVKEKHPDFQRPAGDYDSWFIRDGKTNEHLRGAAFWERIDGALIQYLLTGPLHWLGVVDLARNDKNGSCTAFKLSAIGEDLLNGTPPSRCRVEDGIITVTSDGTLLVPHNTPRAIRYQISRFGEPLHRSSAERKFRITPGSLKQAAGQGLKVSHLIQLLQQAKAKNLPPVLVQQFERWEKYGAEAVVEKVILLRLARPELLPILQKNSRTSTCILAVLNNQNLLIKPGKVEQLRIGLAELGLLADVKIDSEV